MFVQSLATAVPSTVFTQAELYEIFARSEARQRLRTRSASLMRKILLGANGIETRHLATTPIEQIFDLDAEGLNRAFEAHAPTLAAEALREGLALAGHAPADLDALFVCTCTGYLCPGVSSHVAEHVGLRPNIFLQDLVGMGCGAAIPTLRAAMAYGAQHPTARIAVVAVEVCSAAFYLDDDAGVLISAGLFGDGAACVILGHDVQATPGWVLHDFDTLHLPADRELLRFRNVGGKLRNQLDRSVPDCAAAAVSQLFAADHTRQPVDAAPPKILAHPGGRDVIRALSAALPEHPTLAESSWVLHHGGNLSSPSILFALGAHWSGRRDAPPVRLPPTWCNNLPSDTNPTRSLWLTSFGAGFSAHSVRLTAMGGV